MPVASNYAVTFDEGRAYEATDILARPVIIMSSLCAGWVGLAQQIAAGRFPEPFLRPIERPFAFTDQAAPGVLAKVEPQCVDRLGQADPWFQRTEVQETLGDPGKRLQALGCDIADRLLGQRVLGGAPHQSVNDVPVPLLPAARARRAQDHHTPRVVGRWMGRV